MIGVIPNKTPEKPEITDQLALSAIKVIKDYCTNHECRKCGIQNECVDCFGGMPEDWEI